MSEAKPCPFCGENFVSKEQRVTFLSICGNVDCVLYLTRYDTEDWNTRPIEAALQTRLNESEGEVARLREESRVLKSLCRKSAKYVTFDRCDEIKYRVWKALYNVETSMKGDIETFDRMVQDGFVG